MMSKQVVVLAFLLQGASSFAQIAGQWEGTVLLGPSKIAQSMDGDQLYKLQVSKGLLKTLRFQLSLNPDGTFTSKASGYEIPTRRGKGKYAFQSDAITLAFSSEEGQRSNRVISGKIDANKKRFVLLVPSKPGLPVTKIIFVKQTAPTQTR